MAERVASPTDHHHHSHFPSSSSSFSAEQTSSHITTTATTPTPTLPDQTQSQSQSEPLFSSGTYVVQVPKDQIYRVPPPENALIVERHRNPSGGIKKRSHCCRCVCVIVSIAVVVVVVLGIVAALLPVFISPKDPKFNINKFVVNNNIHHARQEYDIKLEVENPNGMGSVSFNEGGKASLSYRSQEIAFAKYPKFRQEHGTWKLIGLILPLKSKVVLPKEMEKSLKSKGTKKHVSFNLKMNLPAQTKSILFINRDVKFVVNCVFTVDSLAKGSRILSQECQSEH